MGRPEITPLLYSELRKEKIPPTSNVVNFLSLAGELAGFVIHCTDKYKPHTTSQDQLEIKLKLVCCQ